MSVTVTPGLRPAFSPPKPLFRKDWYSWDISPDGSRFLGVTSAQPTGAADSSYGVILNWRSSPQK